MWIRRIKRKQQKSDNSLMKCHHDNARPHSANMTKKKVIQELSWKIISHFPNNA